MVGYLDDKIARTAPKEITQSIPRVSVICTADVTSLDSHRSPELELAWISDRGLMALAERINSKTPEELEAEKKELAQLRKERLEKAKQLQVQSLWMDLNVLLYDDFALGLSMYMKSLPYDMYCVASSTLIMRSHGRYGGLRIAGSGFIIEGALSTYEAVSVWSQCACRMGRPLIRSGLCRPPCRRRSRRRRATRRARRWRSTPTSGHSTTSPAVRTWRLSIDADDAHGQVTWCCIQEPCIGGGGGQGVR
jgi:hypothetical protein